MGRWKGKDKVDIRDLNVAVTGNASRDKGLWIIRRIFEIDDMHLSVLPGAHNPISRLDLEYVKPRG